MLMAVVADMAIGSSILSEREGMRLAFCSYIRNSDESTTKGYFRIHRMVQILILSPVGMRITF